MLNKPLCLSLYSRSQYGWSTYTIRSKIIYVCMHSCVKMAGVSACRNFYLGAHNGNESPCILVLICSGVHAFVILRHWLLSMWRYVFIMTFVWIPVNNKLMPLLLRLLKICMYVYICMLVRMQVCMCLRIFVIVWCMFLHMFAHPTVTLLLDYLNVCLIHSM